MNDEAMNGEAMNDDRDEFELRSDWSGRVPKPGAILMLQIVGALGLLAGVAMLILASVLNLEDEPRKIYVLVASVGFVVAPFAFLSGWRRPPGLVAGLVALSILLILFPFGTVASSVIGFFAIKNRDHIRDYYSQPKVKR